MTIDEGADDDNAYRFSSAALRKKGKGRRGRSRLRNKKIVTAEEATARGIARSLSSTSLPPSFGGNKIESNNNTIDTEPVAPVVKPRSPSPPPPPHELDLTSDVRVRDAKKPWETDIWKEHKKADRESILTNDSPSKVETRRGNLRRSRSLSVIGHSGSEPFRASQRRSLRRSLSRNKMDRPVTRRSMSCETLDAHLGETGPDVSENNDSSLSSRTEDDVVKYVDNNFRDSTDPTANDTDSVEDGRHTSSEESFYLPNSDDDYMEERFREEDQTYERYRKFLQKSDSSDVEEDEAETLEYDIVVDPNEQLMKEASKPRLMKSLSILSGKKLSAAPSLDFSYRYSAAADELCDAEQGDVDSEYKDLSCSDNAEQEPPADDQDSEANDFADADYMNDPLAAMAAAEELFRSVSHNNHVDSDGAVNEEENDDNEETQEAQVVEDVKAIRTGQTFRHPQPENDTMSASSSSSSVYTREDMEETHTARDIPLANNDEDVDTTTSTAAEETNDIPIFVGDIVDHSEKDDCEPDRDFENIDSAQIVRNTSSSVEISKQQKARISPASPCSPPSLARSSMSESTTSPSSHQDVSSLFIDQEDEQEKGTAKYTTPLCADVENEISKEKPCDNYEDSVEQASDSVTMGTDVSHSDEIDEENMPADQCDRLNEENRVQETIVASQCRDIEGVYSSEGSTGSNTSPRDPTTLEKAGAMAVTRLLEEVKHPESTDSRTHVTRRRSRERPRSPKARLEDREEKAKRKIDEWARNAKAIAVERIRKEAEAQALAEIEEERKKMEREAAQSLALEAKRLAKDIRKRENAATKQAEERLLAAEAESRRLLAESDDQVGYDQGSVEATKIHFIEPPLTTTEEEDYYDSGEEQEPIEDEERDFMAMLYHIHSV